MTALKSDIAGVQADQLLFSCYSVFACYEGGSVISDISLSLREGELIALVGPGGAGKSTLLRTIARRYEPRLQSGEIWLQKHSLHDKQAFEASKLGIQLVPEGRTIIPGLTVQENIELAKIPGQKGWSFSDIVNLFPLFVRHTVHGWFGVG